MITQSELKSQLNYDKNTGLFTRVISNNKRHKIGNLAGTINYEGYVIIGINKKYYRAHRLAWLYEFGSLPKNQIDHINGIRDDNRLCNLRDVTNAENQQNRTRLNTNNKTGITGIDFRKSKYRVRVCINYKSIYIGDYKTLDEAKIQLANAKNKYHPFNTVNFN